MIELSHNMRNVDATSPIAEFPPEVSEITSRERPAFLQKELEIWVEPRE